MSMSYREAPPSPDLAPFVRSHWEFAVAEGAGGPLLHEVLPDGCVSISFGRIPATGGARLSVVGPRLEGFAVPVWGGSVFRGVRLGPAAGGVVLGREPGALRDLIPDLAEVAPDLAAGLSRSLAGCASFEDAAAAFEAHLRPLAPRAGEIDSAAAAAASFILEAGGAATVSAAAAAVGLTPKQFARVRRLRAAAQLLVGGGEATWAERAARAGYADQSHLTRAFASTTGRSPKRFEERVRAIDHGDLVD
jgi:hypothetical protein